MKSDKLHKIAFLGLFTLLAAVPVLQKAVMTMRSKRLSTCATV